MTVRTWSRVLFLAITVASVQACGDATSPEPAPVPGTLAAATIAASGTVGTGVTTSPAVTVRDTKGRAMSGAQVTFTVTAGGGSVTQGSASTDAAGVASAGVWTLGTQAGVNTLQASVAGLAPVTFSVTAQPDVPAAVAAQASNPASGTVGQPITAAVVVRDRFSNPVANVPVSFVASQGTIASSTANTNASGVAATSWPLGGTAGQQTIQASVAGVSTTVSVQAGAAAASSLEAQTALTQNGTAGVVVGTRPSVRARDAFGNAVPGVTVTFAVASGGGSITGATQTTGADGIATVGGWTLGPVAGANSVTASIAGAQPVTFAAVGAAGAAAKLEKLAGDAQSAVVGTQLAIAPSVRVRDAFDNAVAGATVTFTAGNGGSVAGSPATSGADGVATAGKWTLGNSVGSQQLEAKVGAVTLTFTASATSAPSNPPASAQPVAGQTQTGTVGTAVAVKPAVIVRDALSNPVSGVAVTFSVSIGGGSITGANAVTGADGVATVGSWTLGTVVGENRLRASVAGLGTIDFTASANAGPAATLTITAGDFQTATAGAAVATAPAVRVRDAFGNAISGATVTFSVTGGGGTAIGATKITGATGTAAVGGWLLGAVPGANTLRASVAGVPVVTFTATGLGVAPAGTYNIEVRYVGTISDVHRTAIETAVTRWEDVIRGDLPNVLIQLPAAACSINHPAINETVDDLLIYAEIAPIDGVGKVLGQAGPCLIRGSSSLPAFGIMKFDSADLDNMVANGTLNDVILHEIGHILGIGTIWTDRFLLTGAGGADPFFSGISSVAYFTFAGGAVADGNGVPVENSGGAGTRDSHWRESTLQNELMTGWISGATNPMSAITIGSLADLGYSVNFAAANAFSVPTGFGLRLREANAVQLIELPMPRPKRVW